MSVRIGTGLSTEHDSLQAGTEAARTAAKGLAGAPPDLAVVFASGSHLIAPEATLEGIHGELSPSALIGCGAGGVLGQGRELESGTALAVWAAAFTDGGSATPFHAELAGDTSLLEGVTGDEEAVVELVGLPSVHGSSGVLLLADPYSFPTEAALEVLAMDGLAVPVLGGISSARTTAGGGVGDGGGILFFDDRVCESGAVGVKLQGVELLPCVSQGAAPLGREITITAAEGNVIHELASRPALETVQQIVSELSPRERGLVGGGLLIGVVIDGGKPEYEQGDFLVRGVLGADPESGALVVGASVEAGQVVRLHARDARSADEDLRQELQLRVRALSGEPPAGALVFSCNGRGSSMFGLADHDAMTVEQELSGAPTAGFFAAGEIGPVGGRSFLHGFTATLAVFPKRS
ncbi:MAG TPA: FIST N-terminal domain-containing protein [Solirubrobacteraceae bacterium]|nr:FIST N-terminal domain-containing protein [Solirubrobacteraceae bacterium]